MVKKRPKAKTYSKKKEWERVDDVKEKEVSWRQTEEPYA